MQGDGTFAHEISPSQFNFQNQRFSEIDEDIDAPVHPIANEHYAKDDGFDEQPSFQRYSSNTNLDYDMVLSKKVNNERIKELEKIYLPRLEVRPPRRKK